ncbi:hypothetical protein AcW1_008176 [Taiwanofungus camphoratus]|nr:hypothetical protein AcW1_008176 [Antrodia cinnamomea]
MIKSGGKPPRCIFVRSPRPPLDGTWHHRDQLAAASKPSVCLRLYEDDEAGAEVDAHRSQYGAGKQKRERCKRGEQPASDSEDCVIPDHSCTFRVQRFFPTFKGFHTVGCHAPPPPPPPPLSWSRHH